MKLLFPEDILVKVKRRYESQRRQWLNGEGVWPLSFPLGLPTERDASGAPDQVRRWVEAWNAFLYASFVVWEERKWGRLGVQNLPARVVFLRPEDVAELLGYGSGWQAASERYERVTAKWPSLREHTLLASEFDFLSSASALEFERFVGVLEWFEKNPDSQLYQRQLPIAGVDTKWLEQHKQLVHRTVGIILDRNHLDSFYDRCGLRTQPNRIRIRLLCTDLQDQLGGLRDIEAPIDEVASLPIRPGSCLIVENLATGLAMPAMGNTVCFMKLGNAVSLLAQIPWLHKAKITYWGDLDTHGFLILSRLRREFPFAKSVLMDAQTLLESRELWGVEPSQASDAPLDLLTTSEREVMEGLLSGRWGDRVRLEQERIAWDSVRNAFPESGQ